jgi:hypothetical protein
VRWYRYFVSQSSEFCRYNTLCCFSTSVYCCCLFRIDSVRKLSDTPSHILKRHKNPPQHKNEPNVSQMLQLNSLETQNEIRGCIQKFPDWVDNEVTTINTRWEATQRVMAAELTRLTHKIAIQLHPVAESCTICSSRSRRPVRKLLDTLSCTYWKK